MSKVILIQILLIACVTLFLFFVEWKSKKYIQAFCFAVAALVLGLLSGTVVSKIPMGTDNIKITVLDEKNENAKSKEAFLQEVRVDNETCEILNPVEGKWFWCGERYGYRPDGDERRPDGLTKSITLEVPKGDSRKLIFTANENAGIIQVEAMGEEIRQDLYAEEGQNMTVDIAGTPLNELRVMKLLRCIFFAALYLVLLFGFWILLRFVEKNQESVFGALAKNWDYIVYAILAVYVLVGLMCTVKGDSLWYDELWNIGWYETGDPIYNQYSHHFLMRIWYHLMPYGEQYLLFLTELLSAFAVFLTGIAGKMYGGKRVGIFASAVIASIPYFYKQVGLEFRNYYLLYFSAVVLFIAYMRRGNGKDVRFGRIAAYSLCLALVMDAHPYGMLVAAVFLGIDFLLMIFRRIPWKNIGSFVFPVSYFIIWIFTNDMGGNWNNYSWTAVPNAVSVYQTIFSLCGESMWMVGVLILGIICVAADYYLVTVKAHRGMEENAYKIMPILVAGGVFFASVVYSVWINPQNSLYVSRYFVSVLFFIVLLIAAGFDWIWDGLDRCLTARSKKQIGRLTAAVITAVVLNGSMQFFLHPVVHEEANYDEAAQWLMSQEDIYNKGTLLAVTGNQYVVKGFEYYLTHKGERELPNIRRASYSVPEDIEKYSKIYTLTLLGRNVSDELESVLEHDFVKTGELTKYNMCVYERK